MSAPEVQRMGSAVLLQGSATADAAYLIKVGISVLARRDGIARSIAGVVSAAQLGAGGKGRHVPTRTGGRPRRP